MSTSACTLAVAFSVQNELPFSLRLTYLADDGAAAPFALPASQAWLAPRQRVSLRLPSGEGGGGWLVGERLVWRGAIGARSLTHVVRHTANASTGVAALPALPAPMPPLPPPSNRSFALLLSTETHPLHVCSEPPSGSQAAPACHGMLPPLGRRYLRALPRGTALAAYRPVWGERWEGSGGRGGSARRVATRSIAVANAPYAAAYEGHAARVAVQAAPSAAGAGGGGEAAPLAETRLMNHLAQQALLCRHRREAGEGDELRCVASVPPREFVSLSAAAAKAVAAEGGGGAGWHDVAWHGGSTWQVYEALRLAPLAHDSGHAAVDFGPPLPAASPLARGGAGTWAVTNGHSHPLLACEAPEAPSSSAGPGGTEARETTEATVDAMVSGGLSARCLAPLPPRTSAALPALVDPRRTPRPRLMLGLRLAHQLSMGGAGGPLAGAARGAEEGAPSVDVGIGLVAAPGLGAEAEAVVEEAEAVEEATEGDGAGAGGGGDGERVVAAEAVRMPAQPAPAVEVEDQCAARWAHDGVGAALGGLRAQWPHISASVHAGEVPLSMPADAVEMGTDADPVRKLLLTRALADVPHTHPYRILSPSCDQSGASAEEAAACREVLAIRYNLSTSTDYLALNATATFRAPLEARSRLFASPFMYNIECAALLCAYTRILASSRPYRSKHAAFKVATGHASPFNSRKAIEDALAMLARPFAGLESVTLTEFASGNMYGPVPSLSALAELGVKHVTLHLIDKEYADWLSVAESHPYPSAAPGSDDAGAGAQPLPHAIDWPSVWKEWEERVQSVAGSHVEKMRADDVLDADGEPVRDLLLAVLEHATSRLADAEASLRELDSAREGAARGGGEAEEVVTDARLRVQALLSAPLLPLAHPVVERLAHEHGGGGGASLDDLSALASAVQQGVARRGPPSEALSSARREVGALADEHGSKLMLWVREQQVAALHAWACALGIGLTLRAHAGAREFVDATPPLSSHLILGSDLDPASTDDFRHVVSQSLAPGGFVVSGIQLTEVDAEPAHGGGSASAPRSAHAHAHAHLHAHEHVKGNHYNFASTPQHAAAFDLVQGQLSGVPCFRTPPATELGCVEVAYNWYASLCELGPHLGQAQPLINAVVEHTAGWPTGSRLAERCAAQRHFLGFDGEAADANLRSPYLLRSLMGFCMFHGCTEVGALVGGGDLAGQGTRRLSAEGPAVFA